MTKQVEPEKVQKTGLVLAAVNLILAPLYWLDGRLGISASVLVSAVVIQQLGSEGKSNRAAENIMHNTGRFFVTGEKRETDLENEFANVAEGGAGVYDRVVASFK